MQNYRNWKIGKIVENVEDKGGKRSRAYHNAIASGSKHSTMTLKWE